MPRLTARLLLTFVLVSIFAPVALAISAPAPHACCMRKSMHDHGAPGSEFHSPPGYCQHDCCHPLTVSQVPHLLPSVSAAAASRATALVVERSVVKLTQLVDSSYSGRAPPRSSIA